MASEQGHTAKFSEYAIKHPRLEVVAIVTAKSSLDAMRLLMNRDATWGDLGLDEAVFLRKVRAEKPSYSLFGQCDCGAHSIKDVLAEISRRRKRPHTMRLFLDTLRRAAITKATQA